MSVYKQITFFSNEPSNEPATSPRCRPSSVILFHNEILECLSIPYWISMWLCKDGGPSKWISEMKQKRKMITWIYIFLFVSFLIRKTLLLTLYNNNNGFACVSFLPFPVHIYPLIWRFIKVKFIFPKDIFIPWKARNRRHLNILKSIKSINIYIRSSFILS